MAVSGMQIQDSLIPNCKVVTQRPSGQLDFGILTLCSEEQSFKVLWESGEIQTLNNELDFFHKIGVYERRVTIGDRVRHLGKEGRVCSTNRVITAVFADPNDPGGKIIFPNLQESNLHRILERQVGDLVMHNGWLGLVTKGSVDVTYEFESGVKCLVDQDLESIQDFYYPGKYKLTSDVLERCKWSGGFRYWNLFWYRNKPVKIVNLEIVSLSIFWIDRTKKTLNNLFKPQQEIRGKQNLASVFGLDDPTKEKLKKNEILKLQWDDNLSQNYKNWQESFVSKYILGREETGDDEPLFKKAKETFPYKNGDTFYVKVLFTQTEVEIMFKDESTVTMMAANIKEILPPPSRKPRFPDTNYLIGDAVKDNMDFFNPNKYGFILSQNNQKRTCQVKWAIVNQDKSVSFQTTEMSQYDIMTHKQYQLLKNAPQVVLAQGIFEGVITGMSLFEGKVKVQCAEGPVKFFHPHELEYCTKKLSPLDQSYTVRPVQIQTDAIPISPVYYMTNTASAVLHRSIEEQIAKVTLISEVPMDHSFFNSSCTWSRWYRSDIPTIVAMDIFKTVTLPGLNIWMQRFENRPDLLTAAIVGPPQTIYEDVLFFADILIPTDYPNSLPQVTFKLPRIYNPEWVNPYIQKDRRLRIPSEVLNTVVSSYHESAITKTFKFILTNVLCSEPYLSSVGVSSNVFENNNNKLDNNVLRELKKSRDFNESGIVVISEYIHALLCKPPPTWKHFVENYFHENLPRICERFSQYLDKPEEVLGDNLIRLNKRIGSGFLIHPTSKSFKLAMKSRLDNLNPFLESIQ